MTIRTLSFGSLRDIFSYDDADAGGLAPLKISGGDTDEKVLWSGIGDGGDFNLAAIVLVVLPQGLICNNWCRG
ncbi:hypothetical protein LCGC14_2052130 [marine sediment metagenome]|uniref:Uncharacterized protein n=1 Tax=marine sediment metagenome TaxID=412755 RepID=A0A0F9ENS9_9ZZZZ